MNDLKTIRLYGKLGAKFGRIHRLAVENTGEAIYALCNQLPGFEQYLLESRENGMGFAVFLDKRNIEEPELKLPVGNREIRIAPIILGSKNSGLFSVILGVVLIVVGAIIGYVFFWTAIGPYIGMALIMSGIGMIVGGIVQMLTPNPKRELNTDGKESNASYSFNGPVNTQAQGNPVPLLYGRSFVGSAVVSCGITVNQESAPDYRANEDRIDGGRWTDSDKRMIE